MDGNTIIHTPLYKKLYIALTLTWVVIGSWVSFAHAAGPGDLDTTFHGTGVVTTSIGRSSIGLSIAIQSQDKIVVGGGSSDNNDNNSSTVVRYNSNGSLDTSFAGSGIITTPIKGWRGASGLVIQRDQKIIVAGEGERTPTSSSFTVIRYEKDGNLDSTFGGGTGIVTTSITSGFNRASSAVIQPDDKIIVAGESQRGTSVLYDFTIVRYTDGGTLDSTFNGTGIVTMPVRSDLGTGVQVALQKDQKLVVSGSTDGLGTGVDYDFILARYNSDGSIDSTFGNSGVLTTSISSGVDLVYSLAIQPDGKIVAAGMSDNGQSNYGFAVARYHKNGSLDTTFNGSGIVTITIGGNLDTGYSVSIQPNGKIVVTGITQVEQYADAFDIALVRYNSNGSLDTTFNNSGIVTTSLTSDADIGRAMAIQPDGKIIIAGYSGTLGNYSSVVARYIGDLPYKAIYLPIIAKEIT